MVDGKVFQTDGDSADVMVASLVARMEKRDD